MCLCSQSVCTPTGYNDTRSGARIVATMPGVPVPYRQCSPTSFSNPNSHILLPLLKRATESDADIHRLFRGNLLPSRPLQPSPRKRIASCPHVHMQMGVFHCENTSVFLSCRCLGWGLWPRMKRSFWRGFRSAVGTGLVLSATKCPKAPAGRANEERRHRLCVCF